MAFMHPISGNPLMTKEDLREALRQLTDPLRNLYSEGGARLQIRGAGAGHAEDIADMESFSRILWGLVPHLAGGAEVADLWEVCLKGIINGTTPAYPEYWGDVADYDQRLVEMAVLGLALCLIPERIWEPLNEQERRNLYGWLNQINHHPCHDCNWLFFQVMVNLGFRQIGEPYDAVKMERNLLRIDEFYLRDGWYSDGVGGHSDYYVPFALHFYGLVYAKVMEREDPERCTRFKERSVLFADQFLHWFSADGSALPYGRSLTYRFAQAAFWSAFAFAGIYTDELTPGVVKGLILRNLRWWFKQPIFDSAGLLTVGYAYPNLVMAENYNAPGSPYWALKTFLILALPGDSAFWTEPEEAMPNVEGISVQPEPHLVLCRDQETGHVAAFNSGHCSSNEHTHTSAKYEKFVYSTQFGFSVPRAEWGLGQSAADSMLALSEGGDNLYRVRRRNEETSIRDNVLYAVWKPWSDVEVRTWIVAGLPWHIRIHRIDTRRPLDAAESGFALGAEAELAERTAPGWAAATGPQLAEREAREWAAATGPQLAERTGQGWAAATGPLGASCVRNMLGYQTAELIRANANTNMLFPRTVIPTLRASLQPGVHWLAAAVYGGPSLAEMPEETFPGASNVAFGEEEIVIVTHLGNEVRIELR